MPKRTLSIYTVSAVVIRLVEVKLEARGDDVVRTAAQRAKDLVKRLRCKGQGIGQFVQIDALVAIRARFQTADFQLVFWEIRKLRLHSLLTAWKIRLRHAEDSHTDISKNAVGVKPLSDCEIEVNVVEPWWIAKDGRI